MFVMTVDAPEGLKLLTGTESKVMGMAGKMSGRGSLGVIWRQPLLFRSCFSDLCIYPIGKCYGLMLNVPQRLKYL